MEGPIVQNTNDSEMEGEGSLNYVIEPDGDYPNRFARTLNASGRIYPKDFQSYFDKPDPTIPIVAFLDSGMDPGLFANSQYYKDGFNCMSEILSLIHI